MHPSSGENDGFEILSEFVCEAIPGPSVQVPESCGSGVNEGMQPMADMVVDFSADAGAKDEEKTVSLCACGCGEPTRAGTFLPGHDANLRAAIEESVGGLLPLDRLVEAAREFAAGQLPAEEYQRITREILASGREPPRK